MLSVSPVDMGIVAVVALVVLGPDKLPGAMRSAAKLWNDFNRIRGRLESEARETFGDFPALGAVSRSSVLGSSSALGAAALRTAMRTGVGAINPAGISSAQVGSTQGGPGAVPASDLSQSVLGLLEGNSVSKDGSDGEGVVSVAGGLVTPMAQLWDLDNPICN